MFPKFKTKEEIPAGFVDAYEERDGEWQVKAPAEDPEALKNAGLKALEAEREARKAAEKATKDMETKLKELETAKKATEAGLTEEQLKQLRDQVRGELETEYAEFKTQAEIFAAENRSLKLDNQIKTLAAKHGVRAERIDAWWRQFGDRFDLTADGKPMVKASPATEVVKFIEGELKKELPDFYTGTQAAGGGAGGIQRNGQLVVGTSAEDVIKNPAAALQAAREAA